MIETKSKIDYGNTFKWNTKYSKERCEKLKKLHSDNMKKNNLSEKEIARLINIDIVKKIINKEQCEIPLHLLDQDL